MAKPAKRKFYIPGVDHMRAQVSATVNRLSGSAGCSLKVTKVVLAEQPCSQPVCERIINGLKKLGHPTADYSDIKPWTGAQ
jgi:hypothetical protein